MEINAEGLQIKCYVVDLLQNNSERRWGEEEYVWKVDIYETSFFYNDFLFWHFKQMNFHKLCDIFIHKLFSPISVSSSDEANDGNIYVSIVLKITRDNPC